MSKQVQLLLDMQAAYSYSSYMVSVCHAQRDCSFHTGPLGSGKLGPTVQDDYEGAFDEGAAQVQRLLSRDRKELTGIEDIGQGFQTEFDENVPEKETKQPEKKVTEQASAKASSFSSGATLSHLSMTLCDDPPRMGSSADLSLVVPVSLRMLSLWHLVHNPILTGHVPGMQVNQPHRLGR